MLRQGLLLSVFLPLCCAQTYTFSTFAGNGTAGFSGDGGAAASAEFSNPFAIAVDTAGNIYIADEFNNRIRRITPGGTISTFAGNGTAGFSGDGGAATSAELQNPSGIAIDGAGNVYIADTGNNVIRQVTPNGNINTFAGNNAGGAGFTGDYGPATAAQLNNPSGLAVNSRNELYIADSSNNAVRMVDLQGNISTVAGSASGTIGFSGDNGPATNGLLNNPIGLAIDSAGNIYIADGGNNRIRVISSGTGNISTVAGSTGSGYSGDNGRATSAKLNTPKGVALDAAGNLYIADRFNSAIRLVNPLGTISTIAGPSTGAALYIPCGVAVDAAGKVYIADTGDNQIQLLTPQLQAPSIKSSGVIDAGSFGGFRSIAPGSWIEIYGANLAATSRGWGASDFNGNSAPTSLDGTKVTIAGQAAFVDYISPGQVNAQVPANVASGTQSLTVTNAGGTSAAYSVNVSTTEPGLDAPPDFQVGGSQYAAALFTDGVTYVLPPGSVTGVTSRQAKPGDTITFYGVGFGAVTPAVAPGQITPGNNSIAGTFQLFFAGQPATLLYAGLAPGAVGLYQFNAVVPNVANSDSVPLTFSLNGIPGAQTLFTAIHN